MLKIGFVGCGNMSQALVGAIVRKGVVRAEEVYGTVKHEATVKKVSAEYPGVHVTTSIPETTAPCKLVFLGVKPQNALEVLDAMRESWSPEKILVSICAGVEIPTLEKHLPEKTKVVRVMPNMPCLIGEMAAGYSLNEHCTAEDSALVESVLNAAGLAYRVPESQIDAVAAISGSGPAYVAYLVREFARAGIKAGLPEDIASGLALQTFLGTTKMLKETGMEPQALIDKVTSPKGTTLAGRQVLENGEIQKLFDGTVEASIVRAKELAEAAKKE